MRICLVLGAGSSLANGLYFRAQRLKHTLPPLDTTFFEAVEDHPRLSIGPQLARYFRDVLGREPTTANIRGFRMEEVFADVYYDLLEDQSNTVALAAYTELVDLYLRTLRETTNWLAADARRGAPIGRLIADAADKADEVSIITFNHDLVIENEIHRRARLRNCWCVDEGYGTISSELESLSPPNASIPLFRRHGGGCTHRIQILKPHGSLNWVRRLSGETPTARWLTSSVSKKLLLLPARRLPGRENYTDLRPGRGRKTWPLWPIVIPPIYAKHTISAGVLKTVRDDAKAAVAGAERLVFFGYSLPQLDVEAEKLFERSIQSNANLTDIDVINPEPASAARFAGLAPERRLRWHPTLDSFLEADSS